MALLDNYHKMENPDIRLDENTKRALRLTVDLGCREYAHHHSTGRYESKAVASRVNLSSLESALQMFFPGCKVAKLEGTPQEHSDVTSAAMAYAVTTVKKHGTGFYTSILSPRTWIRFGPSQPKASVHLQAFLARNSKDFDILRLQGIQRGVLANAFSLSDPAERIIGNGISTSQLVFWCIIAHTVERALSATTSELYKEAICNGLSSYFLELKLYRYVFSSNVNYIAKAPELTIYKRGLPLMLYTNESKLLIKGCIPVHVDLYGPPMKMGMIVASFPAQVFAIYFKSVNTKTLEVMCGLLHQFIDKLNDFDLKKQDRFLQLFEKKPVD